MRKLMSNASFIAAGTLSTCFFCCSFAAAQQVDPGYDLFQTVPGSQFQGAPLAGVPLGTYAFPNPGNPVNPVTFSTYNTDTIVQRLGTATPGSPTIPLQMDALQMETVPATSLGGGPVGNYFITLQSTDGTGPVSTGSMTINWTNPTSGTFTSSLDVFFDVHFGALNGPIVYASDEVLSNTLVASSWSNDPEFWAVLLPNQPVPASSPNTYNVPKRHDRRE